MDAHGSLYRQRLLWTEETKLHSDHRAIDESTDQLVCNIVLVNSIKLVNIVNFESLLFRRYSSPTTVIYESNNVTDNNIRTPLIRTRCPQRLRIAVVGGTGLRAIHKPSGLIDNIAFHIMSIFKNNFYLYDKHKLHN